jgi:hypothetical protein
MGIPYYGLEYIVEKNSWEDKNGSVRSGAIATYRSITDPKYDDWHNGDTIQWDSGEKMTWYKYRWYDPVTGSDYCQGYYDDARSLAAKYDFVYSEDLAGIGIWALGYDEGRSELWNIMRDKFSKEPFYVLFDKDLTREQIANIISSVGGEVCGKPGTNNIYRICPENNLSYDLMQAYEARGEVKIVDYIGKEKKIGV